MPRSHNGKFIPSMDELLSMISPNLYVLVLPLDAEAGLYPNFCGEDWLELQVRIQGLTPPSLMRECQQSKNPVVMIFCKNCYSHEDGGDFDMEDGIYNKDNKTKY